MVANKGLGSTMMMRWTSWCTGQNSFFCLLGLGLFSLFFIDNLHFSFYLWDFSYGLHSPPSIGSAMELTEFFPSICSAIELTEFFPSCSDWIFSFFYFLHHSLFPLLNIAWTFSCQQPRFHGRLLFIIRQDAPVSRLKTPTKCIQEFTPTNLLVMSVPPVQPLRAQSMSHITHRYASSPSHSKLHFPHGTTDPRNVLWYQFLKLVSNRI